MSDTMSDDPDTFARRVADAVLAEDKAAQMLGIELIEVRQGYAQVAMTVRDDMLNSQAMAHGAMVFAIADSAFSFAGNTENKKTLAQSCAITYLTPANPNERLTATAERRSQQGRSGVYDVTVTGENGRVVAEFRGNSRTVEGETVVGLGEG